MPSIGYCEVCGFPTQGKNGRKAPRFCSKRCQGKTYAPSPGALQRRSERNLAKSTKAKEQTRARIEARITENPDPRCENCGEFAGHRKDNGLPKRFCSRSCRDKYGRRQRLLTVPRCKEAGCDRPSHARGWCGSHYSRWWNSENPERKDMIRKRRDKRIASASVCEDIDRRVVFERDDWTCNICGGPIPQGAAYPDPLSAQVDHVVPLSQGGEHSYTNVAAAHMRCNLTKQDGLPVDRHELLASLGLSVV